MPTTVTKTVYTFDELSEKAKEKARQWYREGSHEYFDADDFRDNILLESANYHHGLTDVICYYRLNYCQGDGVAFYGDLDLDSICALPNYRQKGDKKANYPTYDLRRRIKQTVEELSFLGYEVTATSGSKNGRYHHYNTMTVEVEVTQEPDLSVHFEEAFAELIADLPEDDPIVVAVRETERRWTPHPWESIVPAVREAETHILVFCDWLEERGKATRKIRQIINAPKRGGELIVSLGADLDTYLKEVSHHIEKVGYAELEYQNSDEVVDETIRTNDYTFDEHGKRDW